jgi:hypothetical protein
MKWILPWMLLTFLSCKNGGSSSDSGGGQGKKEEVKFRESFLVLAIDRGQVISSETVDSYHLKVSPLNGCQGTLIDQIAQWTGHDVSHAVITDCDYSYEMKIGGNQALLEGKSVSYESKGTVLGQELEKVAKYTVRMVFEKIE